MAIAGTESLQVHTAGTSPVVGTPLWKITLQSLPGALGSQMK